uniref:Capsid protein n=1 Tax=Lamedtorquevirus hominid11 TaxID=3160829 RepID=A0AAU8H6F4_9VIRU
MPYFFRPRWRRYWRNYRRRRGTRRKHYARRARRPLRRNRRRRRRTYRVRRRKRFKKKLRKITIKQWQPQNLKKCKIVGHTTLLCCSSGREMYNFISHIYDYVPKDHNFGGGFCIMKFSLSMLYEQWEYWQNFWTASNKNYDLCRYTGCQFKFWRDPIFDYIVAYDINPPLTVAPLVYQSSHPERMLLRKHRVIVRSKLHAPHSKPYKKIKIRPPRTLCTKWFFQKDFSEQPLLLLTITTADLDRQWMAHTEVNPQVGITTINTTMFGTPKFGFTGQGYELFKYLQPGPWELGKTETNSVPKASELWSSTSGLFSRQYLMKGTSGYNPVKDPPYKLDNGTSPQWTQIKDEKYRYTTWPVRYNPFFDKGKGNIITSVILGAASWEPTCEKCTVRELPLWLGFFGYIDWMMKAVVPTGYLVTYTIAFKSPYTQPPNIWIVPIDYTFYSGTNPFNIQITDHDKTNWYPVVKFQQATINGIVTSGPFMPRIDSSKIGWDFHANYKFFFKWGGSLLPGQDIENPDTKETYPIPCNELSRVQIQDPRTQGETALFHPWDLRRGLFSERALKRICEDTELGEHLLAGSLGMPASKRQKTQAEPEYLDPSGYTSARVLQKAEETSSEEEEEEEKTLEQQLRDQRKQQNLIRQQLLALIMETKHKQRLIAMQMGGLE